MKILFIKEQRTKTGIEGTGKNLLYRCIELNKRDISYLVLYNAKDELYKLMLDNNVNVKYLDFPVNSPRNILNKYIDILKIRKTIKTIINDKNITHIHVHNAYLLDFLKKEWNIPITVHHHSAFNENEKIKYFNFKNIFRPRKLLKDIYDKLKVFNYAKADRNIAVSYDAKKTLKLTYGVPSEKIDVVYNGITKIDIDSYKDIRESLGYNEDDILVLSIGRVTKAKGVEEFCQVAKKFKDNSKYKFVFVGGYNGEEYYNNIFNKYSKYVNFLGTRLDVFDLYKSADIFLFLSHREACPNVVIEAMSFGLPMIGWDVVGVSELIKHEKNGVICKFGDMSLVYDTLLMLDRNSKYYKSISIASLAESNKYTIKENTDRILNIFKSLES